MYSFSQPCEAAHSPTPTTVLLPLPAAGKRDQVRFLINLQGLSPDLVRPQQCRQGQMCAHSVIYLMPPCQLAHVNAREER